MLTKDQVTQFWNDGFLCIENVFSPADVLALRQATEDSAVQQDLERRRVKDRIVHLMPATTRHVAFRTLARDPRITRRVATLIGDDVQLSTSKLATKPPKIGAGGFDWHQDFAYYVHTNFDIVSVAVALDDCTPENGGMYAVVGSHRLGILNHNIDGWMTGACVEDKYWTSKPDQVVPLMSKAGGITIHHCLTLHGSPANQSGRPRRLLIYQYRAGHCYQMTDHLWDDTGYQVLGEPSGRVKCVDMDIPLAKSREWERYCGEPHGSIYKQIGPLAREWNQHPHGSTAETA